MLAASSPGDHTDDLAEAALLLAENHDQPLPGLPHTLATRIPDLAAARGHTRPVRRKRRAGTRPFGAQGVRGGPGPGPTA
ncbi:hypothetical protein GCM10010468_22800 [Actinocorallia longicatena]|uniref:Uncharacterized protein n=1 Tax=Actinocorallia longicatena TaxID=111803 RepID=A0ABP6Q6D1_9ACTN